MRLLALLAVLFQLGFGLPVMATEAAPQLHICGSAQHPVAPHHHDMDCLHCPFCAMSVQAALAPALPGLPSPRLLPRRAHIRLPQSRAPPARALLTAYPRGPPSLT